MRVGGLIGVRDMEWGEAGNDTVDDEERIFQSVLEDQLACCNDEGVAGKVEQDGAPPTMYGVAITHTGVYNIVRMFPTDNFVSAGLLARILEEVDVLPEYYCTASVELFGFSFRTSTALVNPRVLFMMYRKRLQCLSSTRCTSSEASLNDNNEKLIKQCSHFLHFIDCFVHRHIVTVAKQNKWTISLSEVTVDLLHNLIELLTELDPLTLIDEQFSVALGNTTMDNGLSNQIGLLQVHTYWTILSISYRLIVGLKSVQSNLLDDLVGNILSVLRLLLDLAVVRFNQVMSEQFNVLLCSHTSVMELWLLTIHCLSHLGNKGYTESFWSLIIGELQKYLHHHDNTTLPGLRHDGQQNDLVNSISVAMAITVVPNQPTSFCWWALSRIVMLLQYDSHGVYHSPEQPFQSDPVLSKFLQQLVTSSLHLVGNSEESPLLKLHLSCYHSITMVIEVSYEPIVLLWEQFYKQFTDTSYSIAHRSVHNPQSIVTNSIRQLHAHVKSICSPDINDTFSYKEEENFQLFLRIIARVIQSSCKESSWKHLKGKILSKFYRKKMMELSNNGISKFTELFLVLARVSDTGEVGKKMTVLLSMRNLATSNEISLTIMWKAIFVLLLTYCDMKHCFKEISDIISPQIGQIVSNLVTRSSDGSSALLWDTVCVILNGIQELLDNSQSFTSGACALIGTYIGELLSCCKGNEIGRVVLFISDIITTINGHYCTINSSTRSTNGLLESQDVSVEKLQHLEALSEITNSLWLCVLPGLRNRVSDVTCSTQLAPLLVSLTDFSLDCVDLCRPHGDHGCYGNLMLEEFAFNDALPAELVSLYLSNALCSDVIRDHVMSHDSTQLQVAHTWLRCVVQMYTPPACVEHVKQLTKCIVRMNLIGSFQNTPVNTEPMATLKVLLGTINTKHSAAVTVMEASHWRDYCKHIIGDLCKYNILLISGSLPSECMKTAYQVSSIVVRCCPKLIYSKVESRCLLPRLLDQLILPMATEKNPLPKGIPLMIKSHLNHFLIGLMQLEPKRDDFIRRKIKQIFLKYFTSYAQRSQPNSLNINPGPNPFMLFLQSCFKPVVTAEDRDNLLFTMELIAVHFLTPSVDSRNYLLPVFQYIGDAIDRISNEELVVRCSLILLGSLLSCQLACETGTSHSTKPDQLKCLVVTIMRKLLQACKRHPLVAPCSSLLPILRDYVVTNLKQYQVATLVPLSTVAMEYCSLVRLFLPSVDKMIEQCSGYSSQMRSSYQSLCDTCNNCSDN